MIRSKRFNALSVEYLKILEEKCDKAGFEVSKQYLDEIDPQNLSKLKAAGMTIIPALEIDIASFRATGEKHIKSRIFSRYAIRFTKNWAK